jgi:undecaprenyl-diphosphatase
MPSTHAAVMACLAGALSPWMVVWPELALLPSIAVITAWARVHAGAHFPSDVLAGLMLGASVGSAASQAFSWG